MHENLAATIYFDLKVFALTRRVKGFRILQTALIQPYCKRLNNVYLQTIWLNFHATEHFNLMYHFNNHIKTCVTSKQLNLNLNCNYFQARKVEELLNKKSDSIDMLFPSSDRWLKLIDYLCGVKLNIESDKA